MPNLYKYHIWCIDETTWVETWATEAPATCPNNNTHSIDSDKTVIVDTVPEQEPRDRSGKIRMHQTSRSFGTKTYFAGSGDDTDDVTDVGGGSPFVINHQVGDPDPQSVYCDFNICENETWIHEGYLQWKDALFDRLDLAIVPRTPTWETVGIKDAVFNGGGLDDMTSGGTYTGSEARDYRVEIDTEGTPDKFRWSNDGGQTWENSNVNITGAAQPLEDGVEITFAATTGHGIGDEWDFRAVVGNYNLYGGYLIIPAAPGAGAVNITNDILEPNGGLVYMPIGDLGEPATAFWNADYNASTHKFENLSAAPTGNGQYNIFGYEVTLARFVNQVPLLGYGFMCMQTSDTDQIGHGMRFKMIAHTVGDHEWLVSIILTMHREKTA